MRWPRSRPSGRCPRRGPLRSAARFSASREHNAWSRADESPAAARQAPSRCGRNGWRATRSRASADEHAVLASAQSWRPRRRTGRASSASTGVGLSSAAPGRAPQALGRRARCACVSPRTTRRGACRTTRRSGEGQACTPRECVRSSRPGSLPPPSPPPTPPWGRTTPASASQPCLAPREQERSASRRFPPSL